MGREINKSAELVQTVETLARRDLGCQYEERRVASESDPVWSKLRELRSHLWLDTGDVDGAASHWSREFEALTTNNTLLNREVQKGIYDDLIQECAASLGGLHGLGHDQLVVETGLVLNARHGLRLVEYFDAQVSVELHTDLADDVEKTVWYGQRLFQMCPERFIVKVPLTPEGFIAARKLTSQGVRINFTLGFSARQNYLAAVLSEPAFVNVFLGRLNSFIASNDLGTGENIGEKTLIASQRAVEELRLQRGLETKQIAASMRDGEQVLRLAGVDVMTMPLGVVEDVASFGIPLHEIRHFSEQEYPVGLEIEKTNVVSVLWNVPSPFRRAVDQLRQELSDEATGDDIRAFFAAQGYGGLFPAWGDADLAAIEADGKIPDYARWAPQLEEGSVDLDALMSRSGLEQFADDQRALDSRIRGHL